jgi:hypothetical protein
VRPRDRRLLGLALGLCVLLRLPSLRYDVISDDEAIYDAMARSVAAGGVMYRDTVDHKPPALVYTYATVRRLAGGTHAPAQRVMDGVHLVGILFALGTCLAIFGVARRLWPDGDAAGWAPLAYAILSTIKQPVDGLAVNGELLLNLPTALAAWATLVAADRRGAARLALDVLAGAAVAAAGLYKYQGLVIGPALAFLWWSRGASERDRPRAVVKAGAAALVGFAAVVGAVALAFASAGALDGARAWGLAFNRQYLAEGPGLAWAFERLALQLGGIVLPALAGYAAGVLGVRRLVRERDRGAHFVAVWTLLAALCVGLGGRFFGHYFVQLELPLALASAPVLAAWWSRSPRALALAWALPAAAFFAIASFPSQTRPILNAADPDYATLGRAIAERTKSADTIWVWGNVPQLYFAADRTPGVAFTFCNYLTGLSPATPSEYQESLATRSGEVREAWALVERDLSAHPPALIVDTAAAGWKSYGKYPIEAYAQLAHALAARYRAEPTTSGVVLYRRND